MAIAAIAIGLTEGSIYALVAVGFVILYRSTKVFNFAQGSFMAIGAYLLLTFHDTWRLPWAIACVASAAVLAAIGLGIYVVIFRHLFGVDQFVAVIATFGLSLLLLVGTQIIWGPNETTLSPPDFLRGSNYFSIAHSIVPAVDVYIVLTSWLLIAVIGIFLYRSRVGVHMRATADSPLLAANLGINIHWTSALAWALTAVCAGVAGMSYGLTTAIDPTSFQNIGLVAFAAILIGGINSIGGALLGGLTLGLVEGAATVTFGGQWSDVVAFSCLLGVLLIRPSGLFGRVSALRL